MKRIIYMSIMVLILLVGCSKIEGNAEHQTINNNIATIIQNQELMNRNIATIIQNQELMNRNLQIVVDNQVTERENLKIMQENIINNYKVR